MSTNRQPVVVAAIVLATLGLTGALVARGAQLLRAPLGPSLGTGLAAVEPAPREPVDGTAILRRNIFEHQPAPTREPSTDAVGEARMDDAPDCEGGTRLVGAFIRRDRPSDSFVALTDSAGRSLLYQDGMTIDERTVTAITPTGVVLRPRSGHPCSLSMSGVRPTAPVPRTPAAGTSPEGLEVAQLEAGITRIGERELVVDRGLVMSLLANPQALLRSARAIPHEEGSRVVGATLYGIRRGSLLDRLGVQSGDLLRTVDGLDVTSPDALLEAVSRLASADRVRIDVVRRGSPITLEYQLR